MASLRNDAGSKVVVKVARYDFGDSIVVVSAGVKWRRFKNISGRWIGPWKKVA